MRIVRLVLVLLMFSIPGMASPLTDYEFGKTMVSLGVTMPQITTTSTTGSSEVISTYGSNYDLSYSVSFGISKPFAIRVHGDMPFVGRGGGYQFSEQNFDFLWGFRIAKPAFIAFYTGYGSFEINGQAREAGFMNHIKYGGLAVYSFENSIDTYLDFAWSDCATLLSVGASYDINQCIQADFSMGGTVFHNGIGSIPSLAEADNIAVWSPELSIAYKF